MVNRSELIRGHNGQINVVSRDLVLNSGFRGWSTGRHVFGPRQTYRDDIAGGFCSELLFYGIVQFGHFAHIDVDFFFPIRRCVSFTTASSEVIFPAQVQNAIGIVKGERLFAVVLVGVQYSVVVRVLSIKQIRRDSLDLQQLVNGIHRAVLAGIGNAESFVFVGFRTAGAAIFISIQPVQNGVDDIICHIRNTGRCHIYQAQPFFFRQQLFQCVQFQQSVDVELGVLVAQTETNTSR